MRTCCHGLRQSWRTGMRRFRRCRWCFHGMIYSSLRGSRRDRCFCLTICTLKPARRIASTWLEGPSWAVVNHFSREQLFCSKSFVVHHHPQSQQSKCHWRPSARIPYHCTHTHTCGYQAVMNLRGSNFSKTTIDKVTMSKLIKHVRTIIIKSRCFIRNPIPPPIPSFPLTHWLNRQNRGSRCGVGSTTWVESNLLRLARASEGTASLRGRWLGHRLTICAYMYIYLYANTHYILHYHYHFVLIQSYTYKIEYEYIATLPYTPWLKIPRVFALQRCLSSPQHFLKPFNEAHKKAIRRASAREP